MVASCTQNTYVLWSGSFCKICMGCCSFDFEGLVCGLPSFREAASCNHDKGGITMNFDAKEMGKRIRKIRMFNGYTQEEYAEKLNLSLVHI